MGTLRESRGGESSGFDRRCDCAHAAVRVPLQVVFSISLSSASRATIASGSPQRAAEISAANAACSAFASPTRAWARISPCIGRMRLAEIRFQSLHSVHPEQQSIHFARHPPRRSDERNAPTGFSVAAPPSAGTVPAHPQRQPRGKSCKFARQVCDALTPFRARAAPVAVRPRTPACSPRRPLDRWRDAPDPRWHAASPRLRACGGASCPCPGHPSSCARGRTCGPPPFVVAVLRALCRSALRRETRLARASASRMPALRSVSCVSFHRQKILPIAAPSHSRPSPRID